MFVRVRAGFQLPKSCVPMEPYPVEYCRKATQV